MGQVARGKSNIARIHYSPENSSNTIPFAVQRFTAPSIRIFFFDAAFYRNKVI